MLDKIADSDCVEDAGKAEGRRKLVMSCACANTCNVHAHDHATAWSSKLPIADLRSFWGMLGCSCYAF